MQCNGHLMTVGLYEGSWDKFGRPKYGCEHSRTTESSAARMGRFFFAYGQAGGYPLSSNSYQSIWWSRHGKEDQILVFGIKI